MIPLASATTVAAAALVLLLGAAVAGDLRHHRIPNRLVAVGLAAALLLAALSPVGDGYFAPVAAGGPGFVHGMLGAATGFGLFVPLYILRAMGAGDVKLMAMAGAFFTPSGAAEAAILTLALGGVIGLAYGAFKGVLRQAVSNVSTMLADALVRRAGGQCAVLDPAFVSAGKVPYALAIAAGVGTHVVLVRCGWTMF